MGGPRRASLRASGGRGTLGRLGGLLRCPVTIHDRRGLAWWGYVSAVTHGVGPARVRLDLDEMGNKVCASYRETSAALGGTLRQSGWHQDFESQAAYGVKERVWSLDEASAAEAEALAAAMLARHSRPTGKAGLGAGAVGPLWVEVEARGWWETLDWTYYWEPRGWQGNLQLGVAQALGSSTSNSRAAQSFTCGSAEGWTAKSAWVRVKRYRAVDNLVLELCADNAGLPGAALASAGTSGAGLQDDFAWAYFNLGAGAALAPNTLYWLVLSRSGANSSTAYYNLAVDESTRYPNGALKVLNGSTWINRSPDADLCFAVGGEADTLAQVARIAAPSACGQFLSGVNLGPGLSGVSARLYRAGKRRGRAEIEDLLRRGTADGARLLASVEPRRALRIYPDSGIPAAALWGDGTLRTLAGAPLAISQQPAGSWVRLADLVDLGLPGGAAPQVFAERVTWDARAGLRLDAG